MGDEREPTDWLLTKVGRGNDATRLDDQHPGDAAWSEGNHVRPLIHGSTYFAELLERIEATPLAAEHLDRDALGENGELEDPTVMADCVDPVGMFEAFERSAAELDRWHDGGRSGPRPPGRLRRLQPPPAAGAQPGEEGGRAGAVPRPARPRRTAHADAAQGRVLRRGFSRARPRRPGEPPPPSGRTAAAW